MIARPQIAPDPAGVKLGLFWLTPGISRGNGLTLIFSGFCLICLFTFNSFVQPYLLEEVLKIPKDRQGSLVGSLNLVQEIVVILLVGFIGAWSDKLGRRIVYVVGVCALAAGFVVYPMAATEAQLYAARIFYALGFAGASVMLHICLAEYSQDATRGRWIGTVGIFNGLGVVLMAFLLSRMPAWYVAAGFDDVQAIRLSYWTFAGYLLFLAAVLRFGLAPGTPQLSKRDSSLQVAAQGLNAARGNPKIMLAYGMAFASRGDLAVLTAFLSLWLVQAGTDAGLSAAEATIKAGQFFGLSQAAGLLWAYPIGIILDRLQRMTAMCVAFGLATLGYFALGQVSDPFGSMMVFACVLAGMGESSAMIAGGVLIGQEAPAKFRGAVLGTFSLLGAFGIMVLTFAAGWVFDIFGRNAPFTMMGFVNLAVLLGALTIRFRAAPAARVQANQSESG